MPAVDAPRTMEDVRHADAVSTERRGAMQSRTTEEVDASARLSQMPAQLLRKDRIEPPGGAEGRSAVVLARGVKCSLGGKAWCGHFTYLPPNHSMAIEKCRQGTALLPCRVERGFGSKNWSGRLRNQEDIHDKVSEKRIPSKARSPELPVRKSAHCRKQVRPGCPKHMQWQFSSA